MATKPRKHYLSDNEIKTLWRNRALADNAMLQCLAELDGCNRAEMQDRLLDIGIISQPIIRPKGRVARPYTERDLNMLIYMVSHNAKYKDISSALGRSLSAISSKILELREDGIL